MVIGFLGLIIKYCLKSKCEHFSLCYGLIVVDRRVDLEVQEEIHKIDNHIQEMDDLEFAKPAAKRPSTSQHSTGGGVTSVV
jgi:hypothetical protein